MGRPLNKKLFGKPSTTDGNQFNIEAWIPDGVGAVSAWILRQHTNNTYLVTDGVDTGRCRLQEGTLTGPGQMRISAMPFGFDIATAIATMEAVGAVSVAGEGTGYEPLDAITLAGDGESSTPAVLTIGEVFLESATTVAPGTGMAPGHDLTIIDGEGSTLTVFDCIPVSVTSIGSAGTNYEPGDVVTLFDGIKDVPATVIITHVAAELVTIGSPGSGYTIGVGTITLAGTPIDGTPPTFDIDAVGTILGQNALDFDGGGSNGTFAAGTLYIVSDTVTYDDGTIIEIDAVASGVVTDFTITTSSTSGLVSDGVTLSQASTTSGAGTGFAPTLGDANQSVFTVSINDAGDLTIVPSEPAGTSGPGAGLTLNLVYEVLAADAGVGSGYTTLPSNPVSQDGNANPAGGTGATFYMDWGVDTVTPDSTPPTSTIPSGTVSTTGEGNGDATFTLSWGVSTASITTPGDYTIIPSDDVTSFDGIPSGGSGATFIVDWGVLAITVTDDGGGYISPPVVSFSGGGGSGTSATSFLTTVGGSTPPDEAVASITVGAGGDGYFATPTVTIGAPVGDVEYVRILNAHQVKTWEGNVYSWDEFLAGGFGEADLDLS